MFLSLKAISIYICLIGSVVKTLSWNTQSREFEPQFGLDFFLAILLHVLMFSYFNTGK